MLNYIDIFSGAGGMSEGFRFNGFNPVAYVEMNSDACDTLRTRNAYYWLKDKNKEEIYRSYLKGKINRDHLMKEVPKKIQNKVINLEMNEHSMIDLFSHIDNLISSENIENVDLVIGGPPCQSFSIANAGRRKGKTEDSRNYLYLHYLKVLEKYSPEIFVFENVPGLISANNGNYLRDMTERFKKLGYDVKYEMLNSNDYGVMQNRKRIIVVGSKTSNDFFSKLERKNNSGTIQQLFEDLPMIEPNEGKNFYHSLNAIKPLSFDLGLRDENDVLTWHKSRHINQRDREIYKKVIKRWNDEGKRLRYDELPSYLQNHKNVTTFLDRFKVIAGDLPYSHTLTAHIAKDGHYYIHPDINQARSISVREAARVQSFPDNYYFEGSRTSVFTQIGNAVPPEMSSSIAKAIEKMMHTI